VACLLLLLLLLLLAFPRLQNSRHWLLLLLLLCNPPLLLLLLLLLFCWLRHSVDRWHLLRLLDGVWHSSSGLVLDLLCLWLASIQWIGHRCDWLLRLVRITWGRHCCGLLTGTGAGSAWESGFDMNAPICSHHVACKVQQRQNQRNSSR
jgi:hypothetical protein